MKVCISQTAHFCVHTYTHNIHTQYTHSITRLLLHAAHTRVISIKQSFTFRLSIVTTVVADSPEEHPLAGRPPTQAVVPDPSPVQ